MPKVHDDIGHKYCVYLGIRDFFSIKLIRTINEAPLSGWKSSPASRPLKQWLRASPFDTGSDAQTELKYKLNTAKQEKRGTRKLVSTTSLSNSKKESDYETYNGIFG